MNGLGKIPTPDKYVYQMLQIAGYNNNLIGKRVLENSCGNGNILTAVVSQYIDISQKEGYDNRQIKQNLEKDIWGFDIDDYAISTTISRLNEITEHRNIKNIDWKIFKQDYLQTGNEKFDFIIGNPPYITYHDLSDNQRLLLKEHFSTCKNGRFDYCYAFIEKSINSISAQGKMIYLVPFSIFRNKFAKELRTLLLEKIYQIIDYTGIDIFPDRSIGTAVIACKNQYESNIIYTGRNGIERKIDKQSLSEKWYFSSPNTKNHIFGDYFNVLNSVATLKNEIFIFEPSFVDEKYFYIGNQKIEKNLGYRAVSPKSKRQNKKLVIIFPYKINNKKVERISEEELRTKYPCTYEYLLQKKSLLCTRKISEGVYWYEYGRSQAVGSILPEKLIMPTIISNKVSIYKETSCSIPFAGYFITRKENSIISLEKAKTILESKNFLEYVMIHGTPTNKQSYRISVKDILNFSF
ncbi:MAG: N-6 DNA methylase [Anaerolineaceae bacterium]|nr:N-6 DNA methylase [Anaerolineaceae bacterium]